MPNDTLTPTAERTLKHALLRIQGRKHLAYERLTQVQHDINSLIREEAEISHTLTQGETP